MLTYYRVTKHTVTNWLLRQSGSYGLAAHCALAEANGWSGRLCCLRWATMAMRARFSPRQAQFYDQCVCSFRNHPVSVAEI